MAAADWVVLDQFLKKVMQGKIRLGPGGSPEDDMQVVLVGDGQALSRDFAGASGQAIYSDLTDEIANGDGYTTGGETVSNVTVEIQAASPENYVVTDFDDVTWTALNKTGIYAAVVKAGDDLIAYSLASPDTSPPTIDVPGVDLTLQVNAAGFLHTIHVPT